MRLTYYAHNLDTLIILMHSMVMYLHVFPLQHEFNNICYGFFNISRKVLEKEKKIIMEAQYVFRDHIYPNFIYSIFKKSVNESIF